MEPTALATIALLTTRTGGDTARALDLAIAWLRRLQRADGSWPISSLDDEPSWMAAYAIWALAQARAVLGRDDLEAPIETGAQWLLTDRRTAVADASKTVQRQQLNIDPSLYGWPWRQGESAWVFPTAISLIAASSAGRSDDARASEAVVYAIDRACQGGGWNFGNPYMLGKPYEPNIVDTASVLLALRASNRIDLPQLATWLARLHELVGRATSPLGLGWGLLALRAFGESTAASTRLLSLQNADGSWTFSSFATSLALLALDSRSSPWEVAGT